MTLGRDEDEQRRRLRAVLDDVDLSVPELWLRYFSLGGNAGQFEVEAYIHGATALPAVQRDLLAQALNELLDELSPGHPRAPFSRSAAGGLSRGPLAALVELLSGMEHAPPERLPHVAATAGRFIGVDVAIYLADFTQNRLIPLLAAAEPDREEFDVDTSRPGRAFRELRPEMSGAGEAPRLWVPLVNGADRLGVVEYALDQTADVVNLHAEGLLDQCLWLARLIARVATASNAMGDSLHLLRHKPPRTPETELLRHLLPPQAAGTESLTIAGVLGEGRAGIGKVFDYALSESTAQIALLSDGHEAGAAGLRTAMAVSAYRAARRNGADVSGQGLAIGECLGKHFGPDSSISGVLVEIQLATGELRYVTAQQPIPFILRTHGPAESLDTRRRPGFRAADVIPGASSPEPGTAVLTPGDWLVLYSHGLTGAADGAGRAFGWERMTDFLREEILAQRHPSEAARRTLRRVEEHHGGPLAHDAALILARWTGAGG